MSKSLLSTAERPPMKRMITTRFWAPKNWTHDPGHFARMKVSNKKDAIKFWGRGVKRIRIEYQELIGY
jgi:hypothetical protein